MPERILHPIGATLYEIEIHSTYTRAGERYYARVYRIEDIVAIARIGHPLRVSIYDGNSGGHYGQPHHLFREPLLAHIRGQAAANHEQAARAERQSGAAV